jgi:hypothetical protein
MPALTCPVIRNASVAAPVHRLKLLLLVAGAIPEATAKHHGSFVEYFTILFQRSIDSMTHPDFQLELMPYHVYYGSCQYPTNSDIDSACGVLITGSRKGSARPAHTHTYAETRLQPHPLMKTSRG